MDFFGFHPMYVVILLALALIIFGPSRLPKMGAQVGRMLREFQAAREGLTQQMREAFEEEPNFGPSTGPTVAVAEQPASEPAGSTEGAVAVAERPLGETIAAGVDPAAGGVVAPAEQEAAAAGESTPEIDLTEVAAATSPAAEATPTVDASEDPAAGERAPGEQDRAGSVLDTPQATAPEERASDAIATDAPVQGVVPQGSATGGVVVESPAEEPAAVQPDGGLDDRETSIPPSPGTVVEAPGAGQSETAAPPAPGNPLASVAADHEGTIPPPDEEARP